MREMMKLRGRCGDDEKELSSDHLWFEDKGEERPNLVENAGSTILPKYYSM